MEKIVEQGYLFDFYGDLLTEHQKKIYEEAVFNDLSLKELADEYHVSRQAVHDIIRRCDIIMADYEEKLHLIEKFEQIKNNLIKIKKLSTQEAINELADAILEEL